MFYVWQIIEKLNKKVKNNFRFRMKFIRQDDVYGHETEPLFSNNSYGAYVQCDDLLERLSIVPEISVF